ncbi:MAG: hypothetical protein ACRD97_04910 [Nitrososphaeraceae archaeon]
MLWYVGSPQSKEEEERNTEILQWLVRKVDPKNAEQFLAEMENKYPRKKLTAILQFVPLLFSSSSDRHLQIDEIAPLLELR